MDGGNTLVLNEESLVWYFTKEDNGRMWVTTHTGPVVFTRKEVQQLRDFLNQPITIPWP